MSFVRLDVGILRSALWIDRPAREVFITALLMAEPREVKVGVEAIMTRSFDPLGFTVPAGWYGFVSADGVVIVSVAGVEREAGMEALERLASRDVESRTGEFEGRRLVRVEGGYVVLDYEKYWRRDNGAAERSRRYRERRSASRRDGVASRRGVTQIDQPVSSRVEAGGVSVSGLPEGFPGSEVEAVEIGLMIGVPAEFTKRVWGESAAIGGLNPWMKTPMPVKNFRWYLSSGWARRRDWEERERVKVGGVREVGGVDAKGVVLKELSDE